MSGACISALGLGKQYTLANKVSVWSRLSAYVSKDRSDAECFWALRGLNFEAREGEAVGIIGRNGSGKSTMLKILSRITQPTEGTARVVGRLASLLELGTGFHADLTGRENIFLNGAMLGMSREECRRSFDAIVEFSELEKFIDTPVKRYSSGMYVRLAFSVAAFLRSEILIIDEVLSVGDIAFQAKSLARLRLAALEEGRIVLVVSHDLNAIRGLCQRVLLLDKGRLVYDGATEPGIQRYLVTRDGRLSFVNVNLADRLNRCTGQVLFSAAECRDEQRATTWATSRGGSPTIVFDYEVQSDVPSLVFFLRLELRGKIIAVARGLVSEFPLKAGQSGTVSVQFLEIALSPNHYSLYAILMRADYEQAYDVLDVNVDLPPLIVRDSPGQANDGLIGLRWNVKCSEAKVVPQFDPLER